MCAKNVLVERDGLEGETGPFIKLSSPGVSISALNIQGVCVVCASLCFWVLPPADKAVLYYRVCGEDPMDRPRVCEEQPGPECCGG